MNLTLLHPPPRSWSVDEAYAWCLRLASSHYENFPVASRLLPRNVRPHIAAVYAFARIADDIADEPGMENEERLRLLDLWQRRLDAAYAGTADHPAFIALGQTVRQFELPQQLFADLLSAFRQDVVTHRYEMFDDVLDYCRRSANPVGRLVLLLFGYHDHALAARSDAICTALQLTNFWQDLGVDVGRDRLYVPREDLRRFGCSEEQLMTGKSSEQFRSLMAFEVDRTKDLFRQGSTLPGVVRQPLRLELRLTWLGGMRVLDKIERSGYTILQNRPRLRWTDVSAMLIRALRPLTN
ncbi:MAG: squalene synthase HpnC [Bacteroidota bacterium]